MRTAFMFIALAAISAESWAAMSIADVRREARFLADGESLVVLAGHVPGRNVLAGGTVRDRADHRFAQAVISVVAELAHIKRDTALGSETVQVGGPRNFERLFRENGADLCCGKERG